ncbi:MAG: archaeosortase A [Methanomicrobiaceae archaeon]|nr:archaeosortase A [Methanomicrobiaceae archaeon]
MAATLLTLSLISFILFLAPVKFRNTDLRRYFAAFGWLFLAFSFFGTTIVYLFENEFVYPAIAVLSLPIFAITIKNCLYEDKTALQITTVATIAFIIYSLVAFIDPISDWMIAQQVDNTVSALSAIGHPASVSAWDTILSNGYIIIITFSCTPIVGMAVMLGIATGVGGTGQQKILASLFAILSLALLNIIRLIFVVVAYSEQWFPYFLDIVSNGYPGYESFYWAHNVIGRISFTLLGIIIVGGGLTFFIPTIRQFYWDILHFYYRGLKIMADSFLRIFKSD